MATNYPVRTFADRLRAVRDKMSQAQFAESIGCSLTTYGRCERGEASLDSSTLARMAEKHGIDLNWLILGAEPKASPRAPASVPEGYALLPRYNVSASAGTGVVVHSEHVVDFVAFNSNWLRQTLGIDPKRAAVITAVGDSMFPTIADGDVLVVDLSADRVLDNAIYALRFGESLSVKRVQLRPNGGLRIISDNTKYMADEIGPDATTEIHIVGRIVWHGGVM